jgi:hypothetical protein
MTKGLATSELKGALRKIAGATTLIPTLAVLSVFLLAGCASQPTHTAATDPRNGDGLGGTGIKTAANPNGDGIGGTGIVGTISGFGSIIVNGLELEFNRGTAVGNDGRPAALDELRVGQVIQGVAVRKDGQLVLESLDIQHAVTGPITKVDYNAQTLTVLGQNVRLNLAGDKAASDAFRTLRAGDVVSVSGLRTSDGTIIATRVDEQSNDGRLIVRGEASDVNASRIRVGSLDVPALADASISKPATGDRVFISGRMINGAFVPDMIRGSGGLPFDSKVGEVSLEGYVPATGGLKIQGATVNGALPADVNPNDRVIVSGHISGSGQVTATTISKVRTVVTIMRARGTQRPAATRPDLPRPERVVPERPQIERPEQSRPERPPIERPGSITGV